MRQKRGLLDFVVTVVACVAVYTQTPVGGLFDRGLGWVFGIERPRRPLTSFFDLEGDGRDEPNDAEIAALISARMTESPELAEQARHFAVPFELLRALDLAAGETGVLLTDAQWNTAQRLLNERALPGTRNDRAAANIAAVLVIDDGAQRLGSTDAGLEAFLLGPQPVERAIRLARDRGLPEPTRLRSHKRYLTRDQREQVRPFVNQVMAIQTGLTFAWPIHGKHRISSPFGERHDPFLGTKRLHNGIDLAVPIGTPVHAAHDGTVRYATYDGVNGNYVKINHGYGLTTAYCHNDQIRIDTGDAATRDQVIALSGNTGRSTGPHLHYIVKIGGKAVDPAAFR